MRFGWWFTLHQAIAPEGPIWTSGKSPGRGVGRSAARGWVFFLRGVGVSYGRGKKGLSLRGQGDALLSSELGTNKTGRTRFWSWLFGESP